MPKKKSSQPPSQDGQAPQQDQPPGERILGAPVFSQPQPTADPKHFAVKHASDKAAYATIDELNKQHKLHALPFPPPRGGDEPQLTLEQVVDNNGLVIKQIEDNKQIVFHALGDCGSTRGPK